MAPRPSKPTPARNLTSETTQANGVLTPGSSMSSGTLTPKMESVEMSFSNIPEGFNSFVSRNGLPGQFTTDEGYQTQEGQEQKIRSDAPSIQTSRQQSRRRESIDLTMDIDSDPQAPGAGLQIVGQKVNLLVNAIEELRQLGIKELDTVLPEGVVVGDQSAGKSSLMGAIAEINLPNNKGMCTRCPSNIKTFPSPDGTWNCTVSLHEYYSFSHDGKRTITKAQPFPPWSEKPEGLNIKQFATISDKRELEDVLKCAQAALLNPSQDPKSFLPGTGVNASKILDVKSTYQNEADFSPNLVAIDISGPGLAALSLYDLPGIFVSSASPEQRYLIKVFENLAAKYIRHQNALIICAVTMQNDPGLSRTSAIIENLQAQNRCVGVLTMPDRLVEGSVHTDFDKILKGQAHILDRGYFVTKQPGPGFKLRPGADYHAQAREEEEAFFDTDSRWTGDWSAFRPRCGTSAFIEATSQMLAKQIADSLDHIEDKINAEAHTVDTALMSLPKLPEENVQHVVRARLQKFSNGVGHILEGGPRSLGFMSDWTQLCKDFRDAIEKSTPKFTFTDPSDYEIEIIDLDDSDDDEEPATPTPSNRKRPDPFNSSQSHRTKQVKVKHDPNSPIDRESSVARSTHSQQPLARPLMGSSVRRNIIQPIRPDEKSTAFDKFSHHGRGFMSIGGIRSIIRRKSSAGVPGHFSDAVYSEICLQAIEPWILLLNCLADQTFKMFRATLLELLNTITCLGDFKQTQLYRSSEAYLSKFIDQLEIEQRRELRELFDRESHKMFTVNDDIHDIFYTEALNALEDARKKHRQMVAIEKNPPGNKQITDPVKKRLEARKLDVGPDPFQKEIRVAAWTRGYYKICAMRFSDNACQAIQNNLFRKVEAQIVGKLESLLGLDEGDTETLCRALMVENAGEAKQRDELLLKKEKLIKAAAKFSRLVTEYRSEEGTADGSQLSDLPMRDFNDNELFVPRHYEAPTVRTQSPDTRGPNRKGPDTNGDI